MILALLCHPPTCWIKLIKGGKMADSFVGWHLISHYHEAMQNNLARRIVQLELGHPMIGGL